MTAEHTDGMTTTTVTLQREPAINLLSMPITWDQREEGEVLTTNGYFRLDELYKNLPPGSPQHNEPQPDRYLTIKIGDAAGDTSLTLELHAAEPPLDLEPWDSIEQAGAEFTFPEPRCMNVNLGEEITALRPLLAKVPKGWNMVRASRHRVHPEIEGATLRIDIWPISGPAGLQRIKHQPAPMPAPKVGSYRSATGHMHNPISDGVETQWRQLTQALWLAGDLTLTVRERSPIPVDSGDVDALAKTTGLTFTPFLWEWFLIQDCYPPGRWVNLFPGYQLLTPGQAGHFRDQLLGGTHHETITPAQFLETYIPIATGTHADALLVADLSPGKSPGSIRELASSPPRSWRSPAHLTRALADAIEYRQPFFGQIPSFDTHTLQWKPAEAAT